jgi:hypothetical protein
MGMIFFVSTFILLPIIIWALISDPSALWQLHCTQDAMEEESARIIARQSVARNQNKRPVLHPNGKNWL